jgi:hypothetical protein
MGVSEDDYRPGEGPVAKVSVSLRAGNIRAVRERVGARGVSAYVDAAVERQIERDLLEEALEVNEAEAAPIPQELRDEAVALFHAVKSAPELQEEAGWLGHEAG